MNNKSDKVEVGKELKDNILIEVPVCGTCMTRNGECKIREMTAEIDKAGRVKLGFVSSKLHRSLNAGVNMCATELDNFCEVWQKARADQLGVKALNVVPVMSKREAFLDALSNAASWINIAKGLGE